MRDVISHHYFDMDVEVVYSVCKDYVPELRLVIKQMLTDLDVPHSEDTAIDQ